MTISTYKSELEVPVPVDQLFSWHENPGAFERLTPPFEPVKVKKRKGGIDGGEVHLQMNLGPIPLPWVARHHDYIKNEQFLDEQVSGPFASWNHAHLFEKINDESSKLTDEIDYKLPFGTIGKTFGGAFAEQKIKQMFAYRRNITKNDLVSQSRYSGSPLNIAVTGGSGLIGSQLKPYLTTAGHSVENIVRGRPQKGELSWNLENRTISNLSDKDVVVHLAGEPISKPLGGMIPLPWTKWKRNEILKSRVEGTKLISEHIASLNNPPKVMICASAVGYYGDRGEELLSESEESGDDYFSHVVSEWEKAAQPAIDAGIRVVFLRIAPVMSPLGGALQVLGNAARLGSSPPVAGGKQWWSWISLDDVVDVIYHSIINEKLSGPVNVASPNPVRQKEWASTLAKVIWGRFGPLTGLIPVPGFALKTVLGEFGDVLALSSIKIDSSKLLDSGYKFRFENLEDCFRHLLGKRTKEELQ
ncbi:MAG: TIGR01777 family protein [Euryarchaeota archaeon]|nr:TIGR01777 family protein [Euryarchaeota archaeon]